MGFRRAARQGAAIQHSTQHEISISLYCIVNHRGRDCDWARCALCLPRCGKSEWDVCGCVERAMRANDATGDLARILQLMGKHIKSNSSKLKVAKAQAPKRPAQGKVAKGKSATKAGATKGSLRGVHQKQKAVAGSFVRSCGLSTAGLNSLMQGALEDLADANVKVKRLPAASVKLKDGIPGGSRGLLAGMPPCDMVLTEPSEPVGCLSVQAARGPLPTPATQPNISSLLDGFKL